MAVTSRTFRIFISSTFGDLQEERNALQKKVFPELRDLCRRRGCRFQAIDLRWGVREEAALDQQTMNICLGEIERCRKISPRPNFIVLLGDRYGWRPLPPEIAAAEFEEIEKHVPNEEERAILRRWYERDDNAVPAVYGLKPRKIAYSEGGSEEGMKKARDEEAASWQRTERTLWGILSSAASATLLTEKQKLKYRASATEQEIAAGALEVEDANKHVFCFFRKIVGLPTDRKAGLYADLREDGSVDLEAKSLLDKLKERLRQRLPNNVFDYEVRWQGQAPDTDHLEKLGRDVVRSLSKIILEEIQGLAEIDPLDKEIADHRAFGRERASVFFGRDKSLRFIEDYAGNPQGYPLAIFGAPGSGKSALMARALEQAQRRNSEWTIIGRFIGTTPASTDARALIEGLCREISRRCSIDESGIPGEYKELVAELPKRMASAAAVRPLLVFVDALDQLQESYNARNLAWLPPRLPENCAVVVSTAPGEVWQTLEKKVPSTHCEALEPLSIEDGGRILDRWLKDSSRTLQPQQREKVLENFRACGWPLYLKLAFEEARLWKSFAAAGPLGPDIPGLVRSLFSRLSAEANYGRILIAKSLGYLRAAKNGLSEDEMIDILSLDAEVFDDFTKRAFHRPPEQKLPTVVWSRLYFDLEPYLVERSADGASLLGFFHRQMGEVAGEKFLAGKQGQDLHEQLALYFSRQRLIDETENVKTPNLRKLSELPYQQTEAGLWDALYETLTDFEFLEAKCTYSGVITVEKRTGQKIYGGVYELIEDYRRALGAFRAEEKNVPEPET
jgi:hypothetical protein